MKTTASKSGIHPITVPTPFPVGPVNLYLLRDHDCLTLVDTGPKTFEAEQALSAGLRELGLSIRDLDQILLTHNHVDHTGLLQDLVEQSGAKVYAHPWTERYLRFDDSFHAHRFAAFADLYRALGLNEEQLEMTIRQVVQYQDFATPGRVDVELLEGDKMPGHEEYRVLYTPGHALDHLSLYREQDGVMLLGDHLIATISSNALIEPALEAGQPRPHTLVLYQEALRKVQALDWDIGYAGHGSAITDQCRLIDQRLQEMSRRAARFAEIVGSGKETCIEIALAMFTRHLNQLPLILSETLGHLDWLVEDGVLAVETDAEGLWHYRLTE